MATQASVAWTLGGVAQGTQTFNLSGYPAGAQVKLDLVASNPPPTGSAGWAATVTFSFAAGPPRVVSGSGTATVLSRTGSVVGSGWAIDGIPRVIAVSSGALWVSGQGDTRLFSGSGTGPQTYTSPAEDFGTLVQNGDGTFSYTGKDQTKWNFNALGNLTGVTDRDGLTRGYGYDDRHRLSTVTASDGSVTTLSYDATTGLLDSISEPGGRTVTLTHTGTDLTGITDSDRTTRTLGYDGAHHLTGDTWSPLVSGQPVHRSLTAPYASSSRSSARRRSL
jgi:YD repeat-containing protein